jgi:hypothetical protein
MRHTNDNEALTHLGMPERTIPVLIPCERGARDGFTALGEPSNTSVRRVGRKVLQEFLDETRRASVERKYGAVPRRDRERILYLLGLADAISRRDPRRLRAAVEGFVSDQEWLQPLWEQIARSPLQELQNELNSLIANARLVVWWADRERRMALGIYCDTASSALSALILSTIGQPGGLGVCRRPQCRKPFIRLRGTSKQDYCSYKCRVAAGMVRYRARKKRKARKRR